MTVTGPILALDLGQRTGFAVGRPGEKPRSGFVDLKGKNEPRQVAFGNLVEWLNTELSQSQPSLIVREAPLPLQASKDRGNSQASVRLMFGLHGVVEATAARFGVPTIEVHAATVRKHFIGTGRGSSRAETKSSVIQRCRVLGYMPWQCLSDDRADALAVWDFACATYGRRQVGRSELYMFGEAVS